MLWHSVVEGLVVLTYWQTYVAGLEYLAIIMIPMGIIAAFAMRSHKAEVAIGCLSMIIMPALDAFGIVVFVLTLSPIVLGISHGAAWGFPWALAVNAPASLLKFVALLLLIGLVVIFIPVLGRLQSMHTLILGAIALALVLTLLRQARPDIVPSNVHYWPGFWFALALLIVGALMAWLGTVAIALLLTPMEAALKGVAEVIMFPMAAIFGFIPVFIYGAWLAAQLPGVR